MFIKMKKCIRINFLILCFVIITQSVVAQSIIAQGGIYVPFPKKRIQDKSLRLAMTSGYAYRLGNLYESGNPDLDKFSENIRHGFHLDGELQYLFHKDFGLGIIVNHIRQSASAEDIRLPGAFHPVDFYKETQAITFLGPTLIGRGENKKWLFAVSGGTGPIFFHSKMTDKNKKVIGTAVSWGINSGMGVQYKFSYNFAAGLKFSITGGATKSIMVEKKNVYDAPTPFSLANIMLSAYCSFRLN